MSINLNALVTSLKWLCDHPAIKQKHELAFDMAFDDDESCFVVSLYPANVHIEVFLQGDGEIHVAKVIFGDGGDETLKDTLSLCLGEENLGLVESLFTTKDISVMYKRFNSIPDLIYSLLTFFIMVETHDDLSEIIKNSSVSCPF